MSDLEEALKTLDDTKAIGPDDFHAAMFKERWSAPVKEQLIDMLNEGKIP